jgi:hypothetical protein
MIVIARPVAELDGVAIGKPGDHAGRPRSRAR